MSTIHPLKRTFQVNVPAVAGGADGTTIICKAPFAGRVVSATYYANSAITGANTNTRKLEIINKGTDGAGTTVMASKQFDSGTNAVALDNTSLTNSAVAHALEHVADALIVLKSTHVGTGIADPGGLIEIELSNEVD